MSYIPRSIQIYRLRPAAHWMEKYIARLYYDIPKEIYSNFEKIFIISKKHFIDAEMLIFLLICNIITVEYISRNIIFLQCAAA